MANKPPLTQRGRRALKAMFLDVEQALQETQIIDDPDPNVERNGIKPGRWPGFPHSNMPPDCPVTVVGYDGEETYLVSATGQFFAVKKFEQETILKLFAPYVNYLHWSWPGWTGKTATDPETGEPLPRKVVRLERNQAVACIINEGRKRGLFDPVQRHRGRGGWRDETGNMLWHDGQHVWTSQNNILKAAKPGMYEGFLYTAQAKTISPWQTSVRREESPAQRILGDLKTWNWERPYIDPLLVLGWIGCALMGAALDVRPPIFTTGGAGVGKSTMQDLIKHVLRGVVFSSADTTAAGVYQTLRQDVLPMMVDELENKPGTSKSQSIIELARIAYSGDDMNRGGADGVPSTYKMRSGFMFSAINPPPLEVQDKSRMAILNLRRLDEGNTKTRMKPKVFPEDGRMLLRQVLDGFHEFSRLKQDYWELLHAQGFDSRQMDTYGTLLASAQLLVGEEAFEDVGLDVTDHRRLGEIIAAATKLDRAEQLDNWHQCVNYLLQSTLDMHRGGERLTVGRCIEELEDPNSGGDTISLTQVQKRLGSAGLGLRRRNDPCIGFGLAVPGSNPQLLKVFEGTKWESGTWTTALKQGPPHIVKRGADIGNKGVVSINRTKMRCLIIDLAAFDEFVQKLQDKEDGTDEGDAKN